MQPKEIAQSTPHEPRRILVCVTGLSPQIVTETLYALAVVQRPAFVPTEVHVITTAVGAQRLRLALLSSEPGWFARLCADHGLPAILFGEAQIHVLCDAAGAPLADIRSPADNALTADFITERVRAFTADAGCALHVSLAGGRKTMGFFAGYALSLFGRAQDRLSHVLVSSPFEQSQDFYYPTPYSRVITVNGGGLADTARAQVTLANIPFVSLRHGLPEALLQGRASFNATVQAAQAALAPAELVIDGARGCIHAAGQTVALPRAQLALLALFARHVMADKAPLCAPVKGVPDAELATHYLRELRLLAGPMGDTERTERTLACGMGDDFFSQTLSRLHRRLRTALGPAAAAYLVDDGGTRPRRYRLALTASAVRFADVTETH